MSQSVTKSLVAEAIGALALVFLGAGSVVADQLSGGKVGLTGIAFAHGLAIATMIAAVGHISGGHFNPAVTAGFMVTRRMPVGQGLSYIGAQLLGAFAGALLLTVSFPTAAQQAVRLGTPALARGINPGVGIIAEAVLTFFLVFVIFGVAVDTRGARALAPLAIGLVITMDILAGGAVTGAAMNPARAFGPALFSGFWRNHLVYWVGPLLGGIVAAWVYESVLLKQ